VRPKLRLVAPLAVALALLPVSAWAQSEPTFDDLLRAVAGHAWTVAAGVGVYLFVALAKQGWLSDWISKKVPTAYQPVFALLLTQVGAVSLAAAQRSPILPAVFQALEAVAIAVFTHQVVIEGARKGKELVPATRTVAARRALMPGNP
jgi:amino acid transporter